MPHLDTLSLAGFGVPALHSKSERQLLSGLRHLRLFNCTMADEILFPGSLETLILRKCVSETDSRLTTQIPLNLAELKHLELSEVNWKVIEDKISLRQDLSPVLTTLSVNKCDGDEVLGRMWLGIINISALKSLKTSAIHWNDNEMQQIAGACGQLEHIDLQDAIITGVSVKMFCLQNPLKTLNLMHCESISPDAIEWARKSGVQVVFKNYVGLPQNPGSRVRYGD